MCDLFKAELIEVVRMHLYMFIYLKKYEELKNLNNLFYVDENLA